MACTRGDTPPAACSDPLRVAQPGFRSGDPFKSVSTTFNLPEAPGAFDTVFWFEVGLRQLGGAGLHLLALLFVLLLPPPAPPCMALGPTHG